MASGFWAFLYFCTFLYVTAFLVYMDGWMGCNDCWQKHGRMEDGGMRLDGMGLDGGIGRIGCDWSGQMVREGRRRGRVIISLEYLAQ
ncbi:hypothetical protein EDC01DRAFT_375000 [Geopyxis carbonaria]|nr:hypothetical protein EDC01DRAFT_375000 [Geopyxis carbonaria]